MLTIALAATADDWPMWRYDARRTAVTTQSIPDELSVHWSRQLGTPAPAFQNSRLRFDAGYEPVAAEGLVVVPSSVNDCVTALKLETGEQVWKYNTNGPVRFAAAVWKDSVCFGSDDGYLYCVELQTGKLRWKHRAVPSDRRLLGNKRLISVWPVRGGPVIADGTVYFAAGVWPFEGVFVYAMDVASGDVVWRNDRLGYLFGQQPHNTQAIGGVAPQGYLVADGDKLILPCSTAYPALLDRRTGKLIEFELPGPGRFPGGWFAAIDETSARAIRRGKITFDTVINSERHEDKMFKGHGVDGISRKIRVGSRTIEFSEKLKGIDAEIHSIICADDRLVVSTLDGTITCLGKVTESDTEPILWKQDTAGLKATELGEQNFTKLLAASPGSNGYAIVAGLEDGELVKLLLLKSQFHVIAIDDSPNCVTRLRETLQAAGMYGSRTSVLLADPSTISLPPYVATMLTTERSDLPMSRWNELCQTLRPYGGVASIPKNLTDRMNTATWLGESNFQLKSVDEQEFVVRAGALPGATDYAGGWTPSADELVRFPLGVLWFDDTLGHFKRSPQPQFVNGVMISRPKDWLAPREKGQYKTDYPLLPTVLSDIYTGRVLADNEQAALRENLDSPDPEKREPSQYRPPRQTNDWKPDQPVVGERKNPLTGKKEPRSFPKTYGCDGGVDYGDFFTLRAGTPAFYDKTAESGTIFLAGPRSGCTNSIIPAGGVLNVPYFYEGCTCSYPLPVAMSLVAMPATHEQWSAWGATDVVADSIERIGLNFGAPGDRITRDGTLWLDYPSVGGPSPQIRVETDPKTARYHYQHSMWIANDFDEPWVAASSVEGLTQLTLRDLKPGVFTVRLYFAEPEFAQVGQRIQSVSVHGKNVLKDFDILKTSNGQMKGIIHEVKNVRCDDAFTLTLSASAGNTSISGVELVRIPE